MTGVSNVVAAFDDDMVFVFVSNMATDNHNVNIPTWICYLHVVETNVDNIPIYICTSI